VVRDQLRKGVVLTIKAPIAIKLKAFLQTLVFLVLQAGILFVVAGRVDIVEIWLYVAVWTIICVLSLAILDADLVAERMRPGGRRQGLRFVPITLALFLQLGRYGS
jgi:hypothetical protein